jgi:uncharacterized Fe-S cluster-containing radical SAM superfamily protein
MTTLFRGDNNYKGGAVGETLGCEANINTPWEHVRKESNKTKPVFSLHLAPLKKLRKLFQKPIS